MFKIRIVNIEWISREGKEAEVLFEINGVRLWAFCHPCQLQGGQEAIASISFIDEDISEFSFWNENSKNEKTVIPSTENRLRYYCYGQITSIHPVVIDCGILQLTFPNFLNDEKCIGEFVYFVLNRLDIN